MRRVDLRAERGQSLVLFSVLLPLILLMTTITWDAGNWWIHRRHLQTKVDAAALAGGGVWQFPCTSNSDTNAAGNGIIDVARKYVGQHTEADGTAYTATSYNPQVGGTPGARIHVVLNGSDWYDDDQGINPADKSGQPDPSGTICNSSFLDVKGTEQDNTPLFGWLPLTPDLKRKARVEIQEIEGLRGLLPIAVRVPKPVSAAAVFYDESNGSIQAVRYFREICLPGPPTVPCDSSIPIGLSEWTTLDAAGGNWARFTPGPTTGVVVATSFRPACSTGTVPSGVTTGPAPCMEDQGFTTVGSFCNQTTGAATPVRCEYANGSGASQTVVSGLQFMRSYAAGPAVTDGPPALRSVWLDGANGCGQPFREAYFNSQTTSCSATFHANVDIGTAAGRTTANTDVKYGIVYGNTAATGNTCLDGQDRPNCDMSPSWSAPVTFDPANARYSFAIRVRLKNTIINPGPNQINCGSTYSATCQWLFTAQGRTTNNITPDQIFANPLQQAFMGDINRSGSVKWLRLTADTGSACDGTPDFGLTDTGEAASVRSDFCNQFFMTMGLQGGLAKDQDEPPIQLNIGATSQSAVLDCDPNISNLKDEIVQGCQDPAYAKNRFDTNPLCPPDSPGQFFNSPKAAPFDTDYPPWRCVLTQTSNAANQIMQGLDERLFGVSNNPTCPADSATTWVKGRNYWHNANVLDDNFTFADDRVGYGTPDPDPTDNLPNRLKTSDPRLVTLFFTPYDSFGGSGNEIFPIVGFGVFYITGYGRVNGNGGWQGGAPEDPCTTGNSDPSPGAGNKPPPDIDMSGNGVIAWGHFVKEVVPDVSATPSGVLCNGSLGFDPCVPVLVE